jgi:hypothetical protein
VLIETRGASLHRIPSSPCLGILLMSAVGVGVPHRPASRTTTWRPASLVFSCRVVCGPAKNKVECAGTTRILSDHMPRPHGMSTPPARLSARHHPSRPSDLIAVRLPK